MKLCLTSCLRIYGAYTGGTFRAAQFGAKVDPNVDVFHHQIVEVMLFVCGITLVLGTGLILFGLRGESTHRKSQ